MFFCRDVQPYGTCPVLAEEEAELCTEDEIPALVWEEKPDKSRSREKADPSCTDDGYDAATYAAIWFHNRDQGGEEGWEPGPHYTPGSFGDVLGHDELWRKIQQNETEDPGPWGGSPA